MLDPLAESRTTKNNVMSYSITALREPFLPHRGTALIHSASRRSAPALGANARAGAFTPMETILVKIFATALALSQVAATPDGVKTRFDRVGDQEQVAQLLRAGCTHMRKA